MSQVISGQVNIGVYAKVNGVWEYVGHYWPGFDEKAKSGHTLAYLRKLAIQYMHKWLALVGATHVRTVLD